MEREARIEAARLTRQKRQEAVDRAQRDRGTLSRAQWKEAVDRYALEFIDAVTRAGLTPPQSRWQRWFGGAEWRLSLPSSRTTDDLGEQTFNMQKVIVSHKGTVLGVSRWLSGGETKFRLSTLDKSGTTRFAPAHEVRYHYTTELARLISSKELPGER